MLQKEEETLQDDAWAVGENRMKLRNANEGKQVQSTGEMKGKTNANHSYVFWLAVAFDYRGKLNGRGGGRKIFYSLHAYSGGGGAQDKLRM